MQRHGPGERLEAAPANSLGMGCWALGGKQWGGQSGKDSFAVLETAWEKGIRHFDTARGYGVSVYLLGRFLEDRRGGAFLASKVFPGEEVSSIRRGLEESLKRLRTDFIDLYYLHWPRAGTPLRGQMEILAQAQAEGLIGAVGVSNFSVSQLVEALSVAPVDFLQCGYHLFWRRIEKETLPFCREAGIRVVSYSSLGQGILTGKFPGQVKFPKGDHRAKVLHFRDDVWPEVHGAVERLKPLAERAGRPLAHLALRWCAAQPGISLVLAGARNPRQVLENVGAMEGPLDPDILAEMTRISEELCPHLPEQDNIFGAHF